MNTITAISMKWISSIIIESEFNFKSLFKLNQYDYLYFQSIYSYVYPNLLTIDRNDYVDYDDGILQLYIRTVK